MPFEGKLGIYLDILPKRVSCGEVEVLTYALLDPGSSTSFCERGLIEALMLSENGCEFETTVETLTTDLPKQLNSTLKKIFFKFNIKENSTLKKLSN